MDVLRISWSGNVGSGKSTMTEAGVQEPYQSMLLGLIANDSNFPQIVRDYPEQFRYEDLFGLYARNPREYAFPFQVTMLVSSMVMEGKISSAGGIALIDRPFCEHRYVFGEARYRQGDIDERDFEVYDSVYQHLSGKIPPPDVYVRLRASIPSLQERIRVRGRPEEQEHVRDSRFLRLLEECADELFVKYIKEPVIEIDTDGMKVSSDGSLDHAYLHRAFGQIFRGIKALDLPKLRK